MGLKRGDILLTRTHIKILNFLVNEEQEEIKKGDVHKIFENKQPHRVNDIIIHLEHMGLILENGKELPKGKKIKILDLNKINSILKIFPHTK